MNQLPAFFKAITSDGLALLMGKPPTALIAQSVGAAYEKWLNTKAKTAHDVLVNEIAKGTRLSTDVDPDTFFGLLHRYLNAAKQGAARSNLQLMAQVLRGSLEQDCPFTPDALAANAELVSSLTRNEIRFLAVLWTSTSTYVPIGPNPNRNQEICESAISTMVPNFLPDRATYNAVGAALCRTGLIISPPVWDGPAYFVTPQLESLVKLCNLEESLSGEV